MRQLWPPPWPSSRCNRQFCGEADPFGPGLPHISLLSHLGELGAQESSNLFQVRNLRLKGCYVARWVLLRCTKQLCH